MEPAAKKLCTENASNTNSAIKEDIVIQSLKEFQVERVLNNSEDKFCVTVEGNFGGSSEKAVILLQKLPFNEEKINETFSKVTDLKTLFKNDVYFNQTAYLPSELNEIKVHTIYPAEEKHIKKYEKQISSFVNETPELYRTVTLPFIESSSYSKRWIYNILEHKKEVDRIICEDMDPDIGFIMVPDMKWTGEQMENLYLQAIVMRRDLSSVRDLRGEHLPLLQNIYDKCTKTIKEKYGLPVSKLRIYFHYQPSFYHLHVHLSALSFEAPGIWAGKAHLLKDVMSNIETDPQFYEKATLSFTIKDNHRLRMLFEKQGYFSED